MQTDPIADFITVLRNASSSRKRDCTVPHSRMREEIAKILSKEGFIDRFEVVDEARKRGGHKFRSLRLHLRYYDDLHRLSPLNRITRISKPSRRVYTDAESNKMVRGGVGIRILSTSHGLMTDKDARQKNVGGEVLVEVW
jgi:small subunit ribosomal protein S8